MIDLPMAILSIQIGNKIIDETIASCEAVRYIERFNTRGLQAKLIKMFGAKLKKQTIAHLKNIKRLKPLWFEKLRLGQFVEFEKNKLSKSLSTLAKICLDEEKQMLKDKSSSDDSDDGKKDLAIAFKKMKPHIDALLSVAGSNDTNIFAIKKLLENNTSISLMSVYSKNKLNQQQDELDKQKEIIASLQKRINAYENLFSEMQRKKIINTQKLGKLQAYKNLRKS